MTTMTAVKFLQSFRPQEHFTKGSWIFVFVNTDLTWLFYEQDKNSCRKLTRAAPYHSGTL